MPDVRCRTVEQMQLVNARCRLVEVAEEQVPERQLRRDDVC
jgi:hypothetical protein